VTVSWRYEHYKIQSLKSRDNYLDLEILERGIFKVLFLILLHSLESHYLDLDLVLVGVLSRSCGFTVLKISRYETNKLLSLNFRRGIYSNNGYNLLGGFWAAPAPSKRQRTPSLFASYDRRCCQATVDACPSRPSVPLRICVMNYIDTVGSLVHSMQTDRWVGIR